MQVTNEQVDAILNAQRAVGIDPGKSGEHPLAVAVARQWLRGALTDDEMARAYQNLAALCPAICFTAE
jgi:hypothetical protein